MILVPEVAPIVSLFDGTLSFQQILDRFSPQGLSAEVLQELIRLLDESLFMTNDRFFAASQRVKDEFRALQVRSPALVGLSYPENPDKLGALVDGYLSPTITQSADEVTGIVAPHIDYRRGGPCYGHIYPHLRTSKADLYILIGTAHQYSTGLFHLCAKDFASPLGVAECNREFVSKVAAGFGIERAFAEEALHKREHSLELQLPFLARVRSGVAIVPVLVGSFHRMLAGGRRPQQYEEYETFVATLSRCIADYRLTGKRVGFIAGVDMAHVGSAFGDTGRLSAERMREIAILDSEYLVAIAQCDKERLFEHVAKDNDARRICGFPSMYTILDVISRTFRRTVGTVIHYDQAVDYSTDCAVTFAGLTLSESAQ